MLRSVAAAGVAASLALAGCGGGGDDGSSAPSSSPPTGAAASAKPSTTTKPSGKAKATGAAENTPAGAARGHASGTEITVADSQYGRVLFGPSRRAIYLFDKEGSSRPACYGDCAAAWPPVLTKGEPRAAGGADAALLGTTDRTDSSSQVTYNGHPLYYYVNDPAGQVACHNVDEFGGLWLVVDPSGSAVQ